MFLDWVRWDSGALGNVAAYNVIGFDATKASATSALLKSGASTLPAHSPITGVAHLLGAFSEDFYYRFYITPKDLDLGNLVSDQTIEVRVWNAFRRSWILNDLVLTNGEGIEVSGQPDPPLQYAPLQERTYSLAISTDGPPSIDASISWEFSNGDSPSLGVVGQRIVPWNWAPNWAQGMLERVQWYTNVIQPYRGEEQRRSLRIEPRLFLEFSAIVPGEDRRIMESILWSWGARVWAVPLWFDGQELTAPLAAGASAIPVDPTDRGYQLGGLVLITTGDARTYEVVEVASLGGSVVLARSTVKSWPIGARVYPAVAATIENEATVARFDGNTSDMRVQWRAVKPFAWAAEATPLYRSIPVLEHNPNWTEDPTLAFTRVVSVLDSNTGLAEVRDHTDMPMAAQRMRYTLPTRAEIGKWKRRLWALRGKHASIWVPTWADDIRLADVVDEVQTTIDVEWLGYTKYLKQDPNRRDVRIEMHNGAIYYRRITGSIELSLDVERLTISSALGVDVAPADVRMVSFMQLSRSDSDQHELSYFTGDVAETAFTARGFRSEL